MLKRIGESFFKVYNKVDLSPYDYRPKPLRPIYGVYHIFCDVGWEAIVERQLSTLRQSGLLEASRRLYVSAIESICSL